MKKLLCVCILFFLVVIPVSAVSAESDDITGHYFESDMRALIAKGIIGGYAPLEYQPDTRISRAEFAAMIVRGLAFESNQTAENTEVLYSDVESDKWYYADIHAASNAGIINGYQDGTFKPNELISRQEMAVMASRAVKGKGINTSAATLGFSDVKKINHDYQDAVKQVVQLRVMAGKGDTFSPLDQTTRGETSAVINRILKLQEIETPETPETPEPPEPPETPDIPKYIIVEFNADGSTKELQMFDDFDRAKNNLVGNQAIMKEKRVVFIKNGLVVSNQFTEIYNDENLSGASRTYVSGGTELQYINADKDWVKVSIGNKYGFVKPEKVNFIHSSQVKGRTHYFKSSSGELYHSIYNHINHTKVDLLVGPAPSFMVTGEKYYSADGVTYKDASGNKVGEAKIYFNTLDLTTTTNYTAEQLDEYLTDNYPAVYAKALAKYLVEKKDYSQEEAEEIANESQLAGLGSYLKEVEAEYSVNALYLMAHAIHESAWGTSAIAFDKRNLFGYGAKDSDPYNGAYTYDSFEGSIEDAAKRITTNYLPSNGAHYNGAFLGNKGAGMNVKYASDPYWGEKIAAHMYRADNYLGGLDRQ